MIDPARLRAVHARLVGERAQAIAASPYEDLARGCRDALAAMATHLAAHREEIERDAFGSFGRFLHVYETTLARFEDVAAHSFALDAPDPGGVFGEAERRVARAMPFLAEPRAYALRALCGAPPFEPPGALARHLLDLRARFADLERLKQRAFADGWRAWGGLVFRQDAQAATLLTAMGDAATFPDLAYAPFDARLARLRAARARWESALVQ